MVTVSQLQPKLLFYNLFRNAIAKQVSVSIGKFL